MIKLKCIKGGVGFNAGMPYNIEHVAIRNDEDGCLCQYSLGKLKEKFEVNLEGVEPVKRKGVVALLPEDSKFEIGQEVMVTDCKFYHGKAFLRGCEYSGEGVLDGYIVETLKESGVSPNDGGLCKYGHALWVRNTGIEAIVEDVKEAVTEVVEQAVTTPKKAKKWSKWIENTTGKCPEGLKRKQEIKLKWSDGDKFVIDNPHDAAWYFSQGDNPVDITHYKVKLKDQEKAKQSKWTKNTGVCPVDGSVKVEFKRRDGQKSTLEAYRCTWRLSGEDYDIIKWRLVD